MKTEKVPRRALTFREGGETAILIEEKGEGKEKRRFQMVAYSGQIIPNHWFWGNFAIDLEGVHIGQQKKPALHEHGSDKIVGYTDKITNDGKLVAEGVFSQSTPAGIEVLGLADEGFPWQASIYIPPTKIEKVKKGEEVKVNGQKLKGPGAVFRKSRLREVSFCALGADEHTEVIALSDGDLVSVEVEGEESIMGNKKTEEVKKMTAEELVKEHPELVNKLREEGITEGLKQGAVDERKRIIAIKRAAFEDMENLTIRLIDEGVSVEEAIRRFNEVEKQRKADRLAELKNKAPASVGPSPDEVDSNIGLSVKERAEKEFAKSSELQDEFGDVGKYVAFKVAEADGRVKILTRKE